MWLRPGFQIQNSNSKKSNNQKTDGTNRIQIVIWHIDIKNLNISISAFNVNDQSSNFNKYKGTEFSNERKKISRLCF